jgi:hypothetical protein
MSALSVAEKAAGFVSEKLPRAADDWMAAVSSPIPLGSSNQPYVHRDLGKDRLIVRIDGGPGLSSYVVFKWIDDDRKYEPTGERFDDLGAVLKAFPKT